MLRKGEDTKVMIYKMLIKQLESEAKKKMEVNWKFLFSLDEISKERDFFFNLLHHIEEMADQFEESDIKTQILSILKYTPPEFLESDAQPSSP